VTPHYRGQPSRRSIYDPISRLYNRHGALGLLHSLSSSCLPERPSHDTPLPHRCAVGSPIAGAPDLRATARHRDLPRRTADRDWRVWPVGRDRARPPDR
jgi:hypothetical protein